jgi:hypothetical protein
VDDPRVFAQSDEQATRASGVFWVILDEVATAYDGFNLG